MFKMKLTMFKILFFSLVFAFAFFQIGCQEEPPKFEKGETKEEIKEELDITEIGLQPIENTHQALNEAVGWEQTPGVKEYRKIVDHNLPELKKLKDHVAPPKLRKDLGRVIEIFEKELSEDPEDKEVWKEAHRIMHDLDWVLLGNVPEDEIYFGASEYLEDKRD